MENSRRESFVEESLMGESEKAVLGILHVPQQTPVPSPAALCPGRLATDTALVGFRAGPAAADDLRSFIYIFILRFYLFT